MKEGLKMDRNYAKRLFNECRDWASIQSMMTEKEYTEFIKLAKEF